MESCTRRSDSLTGAETAAASAAGARAPRTRRAAAIRRALVLGLPAIRCLSLEGDFSGLALRFRGHGARRAELALAGLAQSHRVERELHVIGVIEQRVGRRGRILLGKRERLASAHGL